MCCFYCTCPIIMHLSAGVPVAISSPALMLLLHYPRAKEILLLVMQQQSQWVYIDCAAKIGSTNPSSWECCKLPGNRTWIWHKWCVLASLPAHSPTLLLLWNASLLPTTHLVPTVPLFTNYCQYNSLMMDFGWWSSRDDSKNAGEEGKILRIKLTGHGYN